MRKTIDYTVMAKGRDEGKVFRITEMSASQAERWGLRAMNAMSKALGGFPADLVHRGMQGLTAMGISAFCRAHWEEIEPLIGEMFTCVQFVPNPANPAIVRPLIEDDIEEVYTRTLIRQEVLDLHLGFFKAAVKSILTAAQQALQQPVATEPTQNTSTSPDHSEQ